GSSASADYRLVWADEFNTSGAPDARNWTFERGFVRNRELQWYQPENASCENGLLIIEARRQSVQNSELDSTGTARKGKQITSRIHLRQPDDEGIAPVDLRPL